MTARKPPNPDAMTHREAAKMLGMSVTQIPKLIRDGLLDRVEGQPVSQRRNGGVMSGIELLELTCVGFQ